jgi:hypothetical protein
MCTCMICSPADTCHTSAQCGMTRLSLTKTRNIEDDPGLESVR